MRRSRLAAAALTAALAGGLTACGGTTGPPELTWYMNPDDGGQEALANQCTEEADGAYRIEVSMLPRDASAQREQLARRLAARDSSIDIMSLDPPYIPELAEPGFLAPVPEELQDTDGIVQGAIDSVTWKDEIVAVPFVASTQMLWYRKSVVEEAGLDMDEPVTWEQLIDVATEQEKLLGVQGDKAETLTVWINALIASAGGQIIKNPDAPADETELEIDSDAGRAAAEIMGRIGSEGLAGAGLPTADENASMKLFQGDDGSFMVNWPFVWRAMEDADPDFLDDVGWALYPAISEDQEVAPPVGGIHLGVGAFSEHVDEAYDAIACITTPENQAAYFVTDGNPPAAADAYDDEEVTEEFPMAKDIRDALEIAVPRPQTPFYNDISIGLQNTWHPPNDVDPDSTPADSQEYMTAVLRGERLL